MSTPQRPPGPISVIDRICAINAVLDAEAKGNRKGGYLAPFLRNMGKEGNLDRLADMVAFANHRSQHALNWRGCPPHIFRIYALTSKGVKPDECLDDPEFMRAELEEMAKQDMWQPASEKKGAGDAGKNTIQPTTLGGVAASERAAEQAPDVPARPTSNGKRTRSPSTLELPEARRRRVDPPPITASNTTTPQHAPQQQTPSSAHQAQQSTPSTSHNFTYIHNAIPGCSSPYTGPPSMTPSILGVLGTRYRDPPPLQHCLPHTQYGKGSNDRSSLPQQNPTLAHPQPIHPAHRVLQHGIDFDNHQARSAHQNAGPMHPAYPQQQQQPQKAQYGMLVPPGSSTAPYPSCTPQPRPVHNTSQKQYQYQSRPDYQYKYKTAAQIAAEAARQAAHQVELARQQQLRDIEEQARQQELQRQQQEQERKDREALLTVAVATKEQLLADPDVLLHSYREYLQYFPLREGEREEVFYKTLLANKRFQEYETETAIAVRYAKKYYWRLYRLRDMAECGRLAREEKEGQLREGVLPEGQRRTGAREETLPAGRGLEKETERRLRGNGVVFDLRGWGIPKEMRGC